MGRRDVLWIFGTAVFVLLASGVIVTVSISRCLGDLGCISQFQYSYIVSMNNAISRYTENVFSCSAKGIDGINFLALKDESTDTLECRKINPTEDGIITKIVSAASLVKKEADSSTQPASTELYQDEDFGIAFESFATSAIIKNENEMTSKDATGSIKRFSIESEKSFIDQIKGIISSEGGNNDACQIRVMPESSNEISATIWPRKIEVYEEKAEQKFPDLDDYFNNSQAFIRAAATKDCSQFSDIRETGGYFLYSPTEAPDRYYYVKRTSKADSPTFYSGKIRILPDYDLSQ
ncbi:hypothetical protein HYV71_04265 [Candidatus Uhrbacteria bacterium]|nr:hypothetical protein [Candidatus Uhrbacteria bacterium]